MAERLAMLSPFVIIPCTVIVVPHKIKVSNHSATRFVRFWQKEMKREFLAELLLDYKDGKDPE